MITAIMSDLHLGSRNCQAGLISEFLESRFDRLILNGDTVNSLNFKKLKAGHWKILDRIRNLARQREVILIRGNHDACWRQELGLGPQQVLSALLELPLHEEYLLELPAGHYLVMHGDRFDPTLQWPILTDTADWCYHAVQKVNKKAAKWLKRKVKRMGGVVEIVKRQAVHYAKSRGCQGVITGHTHFCDDEWIDGIHYLNSGCWVDTAGSYVRIEETDVRLCHWTGPEYSASLPAPRETIAERTNGRVRVLNGIAPGSELIGGNS
jgi:UDP-2,3-diacylglucosamine pyrophosphatase LpxH